MPSDIGGDIAIQFDNVSKHYSLALQKEATDIKSMLLHLPRFFSNARRPFVALDQVDLKRRHIPFELTIAYALVTSKRAKLLSSGFFLRHSTGNTFRCHRCAFSHGSHTLGLCFVGSHFTGR